MDVKTAPDIQILMQRVIKRLPLPYIDARRIICMRSFGAKSRARARIWSFPKIWQIALGVEPYYVIEVLASHFDHLSIDDKVRVIIHELMHIPKNFSGALIPHHGLHKNINARTVEGFFLLYKEGS